jgi:branched-chain amino acid aminotransferase
MASWCYLNGKILETASAGVALNDIGLLRGYGVFEVIRTFGKRPFLLAEHVARLQKSAAFMNLTVPAGEDQIRHTIDELIKKNAIASEAQIRIVLTGGPSKDSITFDPNTPTFAILVSELPQLSQEVFEKGVALIVTENQRQIPHIKTLDYLTAVRTWPSAKVRGAFEVLYTCDGTVLECTTSNIFVVKNGALVTPKERILLGTTRNYVAELAQKNGIEVEERALSMQELSSADEVFLTATNKDVVPVVRVDDTAIGGGEPGPTTKRIMKLFYESIPYGR